MADNEIAYINDDGLLTRVEWEYITEHESWFDYVGHQRVNNEVWHVFRLKGA